MFMSMTMQHTFPDMNLAMTLCIKSDPSWITCWLIPPPIIFPLWESYHWRRCVWISGKSNLLCLHKEQTWQVWYQEVYSVSLRQGMFWALKCIQVKVNRTTQSLDCFKDYCLVILIRTYCFNGQILQFTNCFWFFEGKKNQSCRYMQAKLKITAKTKCYVKKTEKRWVCIHEKNSFAVFETEGY